MIEKMPVAGTIRRWIYTEPEGWGDSKITIESAGTRDGSVLLRVRGEAGVWVKRDELEAFIATLRQASQMPCDSCDGKGYK